MALSREQNDKQRLPSSGRSGWDFEKAVSAIHTALRPLRPQGPWSHAAPGTLRSLHALRLPRLPAAGRGKYRAPITVPVGAQDQAGADVLHPSTQPPCSQTSCCPSTAAPPFDKQMPAPNVCNRIKSSTFWRPPKAQSAFRRRRRGQDVYSGAHPPQHRHRAAGSPFHP
jgi:hypothetical protein